MSPYAISTPHRLCLFVNKEEIARAKVSRAVFIDIEVSYHFVFICLEYSQGNNYVGKHLYFPKHFIEAS